MKILAISGSLRSTSSNSALLRAAARLAPPGVEIDLYDGLERLPLFSPDLDVEPLPPSVKELRTRIAGVDTLMISSPEYAHGMPGALKNALDWLVSAVEALGKRALLLSASPGGAAHAHAQLAEVLRTMGFDLVDAGAHVFTRARLDASGEVAGPEMLAVIERALADLAAAARRSPP